MVVLPLARSGAARQGYTAWYTATDACFAPWRGWAAGRRNSAPGTSARATRGTLRAAVLSAQQFRQLGEVRCHAADLVFGEQLCHRAPTGFLHEIEIRKRISGLLGASVGCLRGEFSMIEAGIELFVTHDHTLLLNSFRVVGPILSGTSGNNSNILTQPAPSACRPCSNAKPETTFELLASLE